MNTNANTNLRTLTPEQRDTIAVSLDKIPSGLEKTLGKKSGMSHQKSQGNNMTDNAADKSASNKVNKKCTDKSGNKSNDKTNTMVDKATMTDNTMVEEATMTVDQPIMVDNATMTDKVIDKPIDNMASVHKSSIQDNTTPSSFTPLIPHDPSITTHPLSAWNNIAPRVYTPRALCFPFSSTAGDDLYQATRLLLLVLNDRLKRIVQLRPSFGGKLQLGINLSELDKSTLRQKGEFNDWDVYLQTSPKFRIPIVAQYPYHLRGYAKFLRTWCKSFAPEAVKDWSDAYLEYGELRRAEFPPEPFINPQLTDLRTLKEGGEALPAIQVKVLFLHGGFILNFLGHHSLFDGGAFTQFLNIFADMMRAPLEPTWNDTLPSDHNLSLSLPVMEDKSYEELLDMCPEYKEWEGKEKNGPTHPVCDKLPGREGESLTGSTRIFVFTFAKIEQLSADIHAKHGVKAGIYECLSGLLWSLTYYARFMVAFRSEGGEHESFERFLHDHFATAKPVFSTPTDWTARVAASKSASNDFKEKIAADTANYLGNKITWISTRSVSHSLLLAAAWNLDESLANLAQVIGAIAQSSTDVGKNTKEFLTVRHSLFEALANSDEDDIRQIGLSFDPRQPSEWQMNSWKNFGADTEWLFPLLCPRGADSDGPWRSIVPFNCYSGPDAQSFARRGLGNVSKPDAVRRVQARYGVSGGLWLPAKKEDKKEIQVQISLPEEVMEVFDEVVAKWVDRVIWGERADNPVCK